MGALVYSGKYKLQCHVCPNWDKEHRSMRGCDGPAPQPLFVFEEEKYYECPGRLLTHETALVLQTISVCESLNVLPAVGGVLDQTQAFLTALSEVKRIVQIMSEESKDLK